MRITQDKQLLKLVKVIPPVLVITFAILALAIVINNNQTTLEIELRALQQDFIHSRKSMVEAQVRQLKQQIEYEQSRTEAVLKETIKAQIYQAHTIATDIYNANQYKSEQEVTRLITSALRNLRFNSGRGYFFIYKTSGESVLHPIVPSIEGTQQINRQDSRGNYIVRDMGEMAKKYGETFYTWWFVKPENKDKEFQKIGFGKHFAPYDWFIGTGEYVADVENDIKQRLVKEIANIRYGTNGYAFLIDFDGNILVHFDNNVAGRNLFKEQVAITPKTGQMVIETAQRGEGFVTYSTPIIPSGSGPKDKISFVSGIVPWQWALGMGFYESEIDEQLQERQQEIEQQNKDQLITLLILSFFVTLFFVAMSFLLSRNLAQRFKQYEAKITRDFEELNRLKLESQYQALHDALTKLPNRALLAEHIQHGIKQAKQNNTKLAVVFVDLDDFKKINDLYGHAIGDKFLKLLGDLFLTSIDNQDNVARFGGDEFIFCFPNLTELSEAERKVEKILAIFDQKFSINGKVLYSSCSIGVSVYPDDGDSPDRLIGKADSALYKSKLIQKGSALFFNDEIDKQIKRDFMIETELRGALAKHEISVFYQPQANVKDERIVAVEALIRWECEQMGRISPAEFIPIAEQTGSIIELGTFVINRAMRDISQINQKRATPLKISINISPKQLLAPNFIESVVTASQTHNVSPQIVTLEITENVLISDLSEVRPILERLKDEGFQLSLDDFGSGYSSLSYLNNLPLDEIKIDRSFIDKLLSSPQSDSLVKTIIAIGEFCEFTVVAEGVETIEQYLRLREYKCDLIQGYYFAKPMPFRDLSEKYSS